MMKRKEETIKNLKRNKRIKMKKRILKKRKIRRKIKKSKVK